MFEWLTQNFTCQFLPAFYIFISGTIIGGIIGYKIKQWNDKKVDTYV